MGKRGKSAFADRVANLGDKWNNAKKDAKSGGFVEIPPGVYNFQLIGAEVKESEKAAWLHAAFRFACITEGEYLGCTFVHRCGVEAENSLTFLARDLARLGVDTDDVELNSLDDLDEILSEVANDEPCIRGKIVQKGEYTNLYINQLLDLEPGDIPEYTVGGERSDVPPSGGTTDDEDDNTGAGKSPFEVQVGDRVSADFAGDAYEGVVGKIVHGNATVEFDDGDTDTFPVDELKLVAAGKGDEQGDDGGAEIDVEPGMSVVFEYRGKEHEGTVEKVDAEKGLCHVKREGAAKANIVALTDLEVLTD